jgi:hypothetical protein
MDQKILVSESGSSQQQAADPFVFYKENVLFRIRLLEYDDDTSAYVAYTELAADDTFSFAVADDYDFTTELYAKSNNNLCNVSGDWESGGTADPSLGQISIRVNFNTTAIETAIGTSANIPDNIAEIQIRPSGQSFISGAFSFPIIIYNLIDNVDWVQLTINTDYDPTAINASTIGLNTDQTSNIISAASVRVYYSSAYNYGLVDTVGASSMTITGLTLPSGASGLEELYYERMPSTVDTNYYTVAEMLAVLAAYQPRDQDAVEDNIATFNATGSVIDSGKAMETTLSPASDIKIPTSKAVADYLSSAGVYQLVDGDSVSGNIGIFHATGGVYDSGVSIETALSTNSDTKVPTSKAVNDFVQSATGHNHTGVYQPLHAYLTDIAAMLPSGGAMIYFDGTDFVVLGAPVGSGTFLQMGASSTPQWGDPFPANPVIGSIPVYNAGDWENIASAGIGQLLVGAGSGAPPTWQTLNTLPLTGILGDIIIWDGDEWKAKRGGTDGYVLTSHGVTGVPTWEYLEGLGSSTAGAMLVYGDSGWEDLSAGITGQVLVTRGAGYTPIWGSVTGTGDVMGPAANTALNVPRWDGTDSKTLLNGLGVASAAADLPASGSHAWLLDSAGVADYVEYYSYAMWGDASVAAGTTVIDEVTGVDGGAWTWWYRMYNASGTSVNMRAGNILGAVGSVASGLYEFTEWATQQIGSCTESEVELDMDISGGNFRLKAIVATGIEPWSIRGKRIRIDW